MEAIFFDLETSDKEPIGQILNYSFIHVNSALEIRAELSGIVRISRLQLPRASAILANRIDVLAHQEQARDDERTALKKILEFIVSISEKAREPLALIGFNSARFDIPFLRTSLIRNGLNPYAWRPKTVETDLLHGLKKLYCSNSAFPRIPSSEDAKKLSLRLESVSQAFGILKGKQTHESRDDVILTIELARYLRRTYDFDPVSYAAYEAGSLEKHQRSSRVFGILEPNYDLSSEQRNLRIPMTLLCANQNASLWVDLHRYSNGESRRSIRWVKRVGSCFFVDPEAHETTELTATATRAQEEFKGLHMNNFFGPTECDIEQHIYRLDFDGRDLLSAAIWNGERSALLQSHNMDAKILFKRHELRTHTWGQPNDQQVREDLRKYALRRYGGKVLLAKQEGEVFDEGSDASEQFHPTLEKLFSEIRALREGATAADRALLDALEVFYLRSEIAAGCPELLSPASKSSVSA